MTGEEQNSGDERGNHGKKRRRVDSRRESFKKCRAALYKREEMKQIDGVWTKLNRATQERAKKDHRGEGMNKVIYNRVRNTQTEQEDFILEPQQLP